MCLDIKTAMGLSLTTLKDSQTTKTPYGLVIRYSLLAVTNSLISTRLQPGVYRLLRQSPHFVPSILHLHYSAVGLGDRHTPVKIRRSQIVCLYVPVRIANNTPHAHHGNFLATGPSTLNRSSSLSTQLNTSLVQIGRTCGF